MKLWFIFSLLCICSKPNAQSLQIGQKVPDALLKNIRSYISDTNSTKLIILDFWATTCGACLKALPEMQQLQDKFENKIQIILVNSQENAEQIKKRFEVHKFRVKLPNLPSVVGDHIYIRYFPHETLPHHVWIDNHGIVKAITSSYNTTAQNITIFLETGQAAFNVKKDFLGFKWGDEIIKVSNDDYAGDLKTYSGFMNYIEGIQGGKTIKDTITGQISKLLLYNVPILSLYKYAFSRNLAINNQFELPNRVWLDSSIEKQLLYPSNPSLLDDWKTHNLYSYFITLPISSDALLFDWMQTDLNRFFGASRNMTGQIEKRKLRCLVIKLKDHPVISKGGLRKSFVTDSSLVATNLPFTSFYLYLAKALKDTKMPLINETDFTGAIDFEIQSGLQDTSILRKELLRNNFILLEEEREVHILVLKRLKD